MCLFVSVLLGSCRLSVGCMRFVPYGDHTVEAPSRVAYFHQLNRLAQKLASAEDCSPKARPPIWPNGHAHCCLVLNK